MKEKNCDRCDCNDCLKNNGEHGCVGCLECGATLGCENKITMKEFMDNKLHTHLSFIHSHFTSKYGLENQIWKWIEEAGELTVELAKSRGDWSNDKVIEETADYFICLLQNVDFVEECSVQNLYKFDMYSWITLIPELYINKNNSKLEMDCDAIEMYSIIKGQIEKVGCEYKLNYKIYEKVMRTLDRIEKGYYESEEN